MKKIEFLQDHGSFKKGDVVKIGPFAAASLIDAGVAKAKLGKVKAEVIKTKELKTKKAKK